MRAIKAIIQRDILIALRSGGAWLHSLVFFAIFLTISAIALDGKLDVIRPLGAALIWLSLILSLLLSFDHIFQTDSDDGSLSHIKMSGMPLTNYVVGKCCVQWLLTIVPLLVLLPIAALLMGLSITSWAGLLFAVLAASPALICYGAFSGACLVGQKGGGVLLVLLTIPLLIPVLIFGLSAGDEYTNVGLAASQFQALSGLSLIAMAIGIPAAASALNTTLE